MLTSPAYLEVFTGLGQSFALPTHLSESLECFTCELFGEKCLSIDEARYFLFCLGSNDEFKLPPT